MADPRVPPDLVDWLKKTFPPSCMTPTETIEDHLRRAGKVELAQTLIRFGSKDQEPGNFTFEED